MTHRRLRPLALAGLLVGTLACADDDAVCVSSDVGQVCAANGNDMIGFSGDGLAPGSEVVIDEPEIGPVPYAVDADGRFESSGGVVSMIPGKAFTFSVTAVDGDGDELTGLIEIAIR